MVNFGLGFDISGLAIEALVTAKESKDFRVRVKEYTKALSNSAYLSFL
ncbi:hypothetical protein [Pyrococcus horikoshii]|uniref:Uncharacterized protein n=1 Tax=Pyrococcus horikoshii TaxID=53953 RepID=A0A832SMX9_PYRHR|nr:hypothetical protein [Pyrococcus horikoshii]HII61287.1 hypothetical protein [Pyrococcus horikoshii]